MPGQARTQGEFPAQPIAADLMAFDHLWLGCIVGIQRKKRVIDKISMIARNVSGCPNGIEST